VSDDNNRNLQYFESTSMRGLYEAIQNWQSETNKRLLSLGVERDGDEFCCIALTNPTEVIIKDRSGYGGVDVSFSALKVRSE